MSIVKYIAIILVCLLLSAKLKAQFVDYGADPARLKWNIVHTAHYKLIYQRGNDSLAYRYAVFLENTYPHVQKTMASGKQAKFSVVLHSTNMLSNGLVSWAPRRMELITTPSPGTFAQSWDKQLVLHESRHVLQTGNLLQGIFKPLYYVIGEQAAGIAAFAVPKWFFEGDATAYETALSSSGRGRLPEFSMPYRARTSTNNFFTFDKWSLGSYKDYTGNYYALGYNITAFAQHEYGADIWDKVTSRYARRIYAIPPFSNALKYYTGVTTKGLFNQTFNFLSKEWKQQDSVYRQSHLSALSNSSSELYPESPHYVSPLAKRYTSYKYPQVINDSSVLAIKSSLRDINSLVVIKNGHEEQLCYIGNINSSITLSNNRVYWSEYVSGIRWTHENYSVVKYYDFNTKRITTLTPRQRYLAPTVDSSGKTLAVSHYSNAGKSSVMLLNANNGKQIAEYAVPVQAFVKDLVFSTSNNVIVSAVYDKGLSFLQVDARSGEWSGVMKPTTANITSLSAHGNKLLFESGLNGTNNIYYLDTLSTQAYRLTSARFGAFTPTMSPSGKQLFYSDYQISGYRIASVAVDSLKAEPVDFRQLYKHPLAESISKQANFNVDSSDLTAVHFDPKPYRRGLSLFKIHSWAPFYYDVNDAITLQPDDFSTIIKPGVTLLSQNTLNTAIAQMGWYYNDGYHHGKLAFTYMGWYPVIDVSVDYGGKAFDVAWQKDDSNRDIAVFSYANRNLIEAEAQVYIPFNLTRNHYVRGFMPSVIYNYTNNTYQQYNNGEVHDFQYVKSELRYYHYRKLARRDILPRWGYQLRLQHLTAPFASKGFGSLYAAQLTAYVPGFIRNDGLMLRFAYQYQSIDNGAFYMPKRIIDKARGYNYSYATRQQQVFKADYSFNIICPDFSIGSLAYIKRVRGNVFYDISRNQANERSGWSSQSSYGADIIFDWNALRLSYPLSFGVRVIKPIDYGNLQAEALFSIAFQ